MKPYNPDDDTPTVKIPSGLSRRDWFAGMALMGFCANDGIGRVCASDDIAIRATTRADALIAELDRPPEA